MGFFDGIQKSGFQAAQVKTSSIKQEIVKTTLNPRKSFIPYPHHSMQRTIPAKLARKQQHDSPKPSPRTLPKNAQKRPASTQQRLESDSDDDVSDQGLGDARKRARRSSDVEPDLNRQIRSTKAFSEEDGGTIKMVHAVEIASLDKPTKYKAAFPNIPQALKIQLQYPSASPKERYASLRLIE